MLKENLHPLTLLEAGLRPLSMYAAVILIAFT